MLLFGQLLVFAIRNRLKGLGLGCLLVTGIEMLKMVAWKIFGPIAKFLIWINNINININYYFISKLVG
jgi:hypothetical protein